MLDCPREMQTNKQFNFEKKKKKGLEFRMLYNGSLSGTHAARSGEQ